MAQAGFTPISLYYSTTAAAAPVAGDLVNGELAINITDGKLYYKDNLGVVQVIASKASASPVTSISFGTTGLTPSTATSGAVTVGGVLSVANGGTGTSSTAYCNLGLNVIGTLPISNGGTGAITVSGARTSLGATTVGSNLFTLTNPSAVSFLQINADNTVSSLDAASFRTAIGVGSGTVTSVSATLPLVSSGGSTPTISLAGTVAIGNGGTGATTASGARTSLGATTVGSNLFTLTNPSAISFLQVNADNTVSSLDAAAFRTAIGVGTGSGSVTSVDVSGGTTGLTTSGGPVTTSGTITLGGTLAISNGGTGATTAAGARTALGSTTVGSNLFTLTNPSAVTFPRFNADNTVSALDAASFRTAIGAGTGTGTVTSVAVSGGTTGLTTSGGPITASGTITLAGTLAVANGGTGATTAAGARTALGATTVGSNLLTLADPGAIRFLQVNADNTVSALNAGAFRTAIGAGTGSGTVTSVGITGTNITVVSGSPVTTSGTIAISIPQAVATTSNVQFGSFGVGTPASGTSGEIRATDNVTAYYSSDRNLKENIKDVDGALEKVCAIGSKTFDWTDEYIAAKGGEDGYFIQKSDFGVVAQDVQSVFPQAVRTRQDGTLAVDYEKLATLAFGAIKELVKRVEALEAK